MLFAEVAISDALVGAILTAIIGGFGLLFRELTSAWKRERDRERELLDMETRKKNFENVAEDAVKVAVGLGNQGLPPAVIVADVVPNSHSPSTPEQREAARLETLKAALESVKVATGLPPKEIPAEGVEFVSEVPPPNQES